ncbi:hypothetical protein GTY79_06255 [Streptomyces sp. SID8385]|nr:hypothetical protein [Streptomyces sp. SID8385]
MSSARTLLTMGESGEAGESVGLVVGVLGALPLVAAVVMVVWVVARPRDTVRQRLGGCLYVFRQGIPVGFGVVRGCWGYAASSTFFGVRGS